MLSNEELEAIMKKLESLDQERKEAKDQLWKLMVNEGDEETVKNTAAYVRYLENEHKRIMDIIRNK